MAAEDFITFQKFNDPGLAIELAEELKQNNIAYIIDDTNYFDPSFAVSETNKEYNVKLKKENFEKANDVLLQLSTTQLENVEKDYYLFDFTNEELMEIIAKSDEWSKFDFMLAQQILKKRGKEINAERIDSLKKQRLNELSKPEEGQKQLIFYGYAIALLGGFLSIFIGRHLMNYKKTLPNGDRVYNYSDTDRKHGKRILQFSLFCMALWIIGITMHFRHRFH